MKNLAKIHIDHAHINAIYAEIGERCCADPTCKITLSPSHLVRLVERLDEVVVPSISQRSER